jgi:hypothetical protein
MIRSDAINAARGDVHSSNSSGVTSVIAVTTPDSKYHNRRAVSRCRPWSWVKDLPRRARSLSATPVRNPPHNARNIFSSGT